jgi:hypothetical protein
MRGVASLRHPQHLEIRSPGGESASVADGSDDILLAMDE